MCERFTSISLLSGIQQIILKANYTWCYKSLTSDICFASHLLSINIFFSSVKWHHQNTGFSHRKQLDVLININVLSNRKFHIVI